MRASEYDSLTLEVGPKTKGKLYAIISSEGVREKPDYRLGGEGLQLTRRFLDASGEELDLEAGTHALGDLVTIELRAQGIPITTLPSATNGEPQTAAKAS